VRAAGRLRRTRFAAVPVTAAAVALVTAALADDSAHERRLISFSSYVGKRPWIYTVEPDGRNLRRLGPGENAAWSPDGSKLAFARDHDSADVYLMGLDGSGRRRIIRARGGVGGPAWSPDGRRIAINACIRGCGIWIARPDGSGLTRVARDRSQVYGQPIWAPDSRSIALMTADPDGIVVLDLASGRARRMTRKLDYDPVWAPDSSAIAFTRVTPRFRQRGERWEIDVLSLTGTSRHRLRSLVSPRPEQLGDPAWSPDGKLIAFDTEVRHASSCGRAGGNAIYVVAPDGIGLRRMTPYGPPHESPRWSPDSTQLLYTSLTCRQYTAPEAIDEWPLYLVNRDGSGRRRLGRRAHTVGLDFAWQPQRGP